MTWTTEEIAGLVEPDRAHRKAYTDPDIFDMEMERIFERTWIYVGHESQVKKRGDYYLAQVGRQPVIMIRGQDDKVNVLYNRCPHRGAQICSARKGNTGKHFYCSYHAWTFHLDGKLEGMPAKREYEGTNLDFDDPEFHMARPAQVDNYRGFWFVNLSKGGHDLKTHLGEAAAAFDQLIDRAPGKETEIVGDCFRMVQQSNWKIFLENQLDASHPGVTHESTGKAAQKLEAKIRQEGEEPPMELSFLSDFARLGHDGWTKFGTVGYRNGHSSLEGYMGLRPDDPDTNEYVRRMHEAYGERKAEEILGTNIHHMLVYPCNSVQPPLQQLRTIRPLAHDKTLTEIWHFRLKNAPEKIYRRSLAYYYMVNSPSTLINADDLFNWWKCQHGLDSSASEWVSFHRKAGQDEERDGVSYSAPESMSELPLRHMMHAWREYMTATVGEQL